MIRTRNGLLCAVLGGALLSLGLPFVCYAQVTATSGAGNLSTVVSPPAAGVYTITGGTRPSNGTNLFHSFGNFSLSTPETANFNNDSGQATTNILARVTGGNPSNIFGTIQTTGFGAANLFLMNPFGIFFGPTAKLSVGGSFHATTADYIKLGTDGVFYADPALPTMLNVAPPSAFGFLTANPKSIDVQAGVFSSPLNQTSVLQVPSGGTLSLVGGPVNVGAPSGQPPAGFVRAPGGRVNLVSVASAGEAPFDGTGFSVDSFQQLGPINITGRAVVDGREVFIRGGELVINNAAIFPGFFRLLQVPMSNGALAPAISGGEVNISVAKAVTITGSAPTLAPQMREWGIQTSTGVALVASGAPPPLDSPNVTINTGSFLLSGQPAAIRTTRNGPGKSPLVTITADTVEVRNGAFVSVINSYSNSALEGGGGIVVNARDVTLSSDGNSGFTGLAAQGTFNSGYSAVGTNALITPAVIPLLTTADSGSITINAGKLSMLGSASATTDSFSFGKGGTVTINAGDVLLVGAGANTGVIAAQSLLVGSSGNVAINATGKIDIQNGFRVSTNTGGSGNAGEVNLTAPSITATGADTRIQSGTGQSLDADLRFFAFTFNNFFTNDPRFKTPIPNPNNPNTDPTAPYRTLRAILGVTPRPGDLLDVMAKLNALGLTVVADLTPGDGGKVSIVHTPTLALDTGARIETSTLWDGNAGAIIGDVGSLSVNGGASIRSRSGGQRSDGIFVGTGNGGNIAFTASDTISVSGANSTISTTTFGDGRAGNVLLSANRVDVQNGGSITSDSGGVLAGQFFAGGGRGGDLNITAPQVNVLDGATISASSGGTASALAGNVNIVTDNLTMKDASITTQSALADGGNISITTNGSQVYLLNSQITTSVQSGVGGGGNITLGSGGHPIEFIILNGSQIRADAFGGPGGNIAIFADTFLTGDSLVSASSALSAPGVIDIQAKFTNLSGNIVQLPENVLQAASLLRAACAARLSAGKASSLVVAGREGVPLEPGGVMPSPLIAESPTDLAPSRGASDWEPLPGAWRVSLHSKCSM